MKSFFPKILLVFSLFIIGAGCSQEQQRWQAFTYPEGFDAIVDDQSAIESAGPVFNSLSECRLWSIEQLPDNPFADYECGRGCSFRKEYGTYVCKETRQ